MNSYMLELLTSGAVTDMVSYHYSDLARWYNHDQYQNLRSLTVLQTVLEAEMPHGGAGQMDTVVWMDWSYV